jgi:hypothetical protein
MKMLTTLVSLTTIVLAMNAANADEFPGPGGVLLSNRCNSVVSNLYFQYPLYMASPVGSSCRLPNGEPGLVGG